MDIKTLSSKLLNAKICEKSFTDSEKNVGMFHHDVVCFSCHHGTVVSEGQHPATHDVALIKHLLLAQPGRARSEGRVCHGAAPPAPPPLPSVAVCTRNRSGHCPRWLSVETTRYERRSVASETCPPACRELHKTRCSDRPAFDSCHVKQYDGGLCDEFQIGEKRALWLKPSAVGFRSKN